MKTIREPEIKVFWDNCVWMPFFGLGNNADSDGEIGRKEFLLQYVMPRMQDGSAGIVFSPCLFADIQKDVSLEHFRTLLKSIERDGYITILEPSSDWDGLATLRSDIRRDVAKHPEVVSHLQPDKSKISLGDSAVVFASLSTDVDELWTFDGLLLALNQRGCVRGLKICEPHPLQLQAVLPLG